MTTTSRRIAALLLGTVVATTNLSAQQSAELRGPSEAADVLDSIDALRRLHHPGSGPKSTLWDAWLPTPNLWPAGDDHEARVAAWQRALASRRLDPQGRVATHQHPSIAHPEGWPFPFWNQGAGSFGWHFSFAGTVGPPWRKATTDDATGFHLDGLESLGIEPDLGWRLRVTGDSPTITTPLPAHADGFQAPFLQLRARLPENRRPLIEVRWTSGTSSTLHTRRFEPARRDGLDAPYFVLPLHDADAWASRRITSLALRFPHAVPGDELVVRAVFSQYDTRHNVNAQAFADGVVAVASWSGDLAFLRDQAPRVRRALSWFLDEHRVHELGFVRTTWQGHDGRPGFTVHPDGSKTLHPGHGIGNDFWDLLPFGADDCYATLRLHGSLRRWADVERAIARHPEWRIGAPPAVLRSAAIEALLARMRRAADRRFWNPETGRFVACVDSDGTPHDYGFTFVNLEAIHDGVASTPRARSIVEWVAGLRTVAGDTSTGPDIYRYRFGPRSTTLRNVGWYGWYWHGPESLPFGGQVQDGGAVLGFAYHDLMARLRVLGPDDAWQRLTEIATWFREVQDAGGYRAYYHGSREGTLQGGGQAGGLGMDHEFFESALVPQIVIEGFLGLRAGLDELALEPRLPKALSWLEVAGIHWQDQVLTLRVDRATIHVTREIGGARAIPLRVGGEPVVVPADAPDAHFLR